MTGPASRTVRFLTGSAPRPARPHGAARLPSRPRARARPRRPSSSGAPTPLRTAPSPRKGRAHTRKGHVCTCTRLAHRGRAERAAPVRVPARVRPVSMAPLITSSKPAATIPRSCPAHGGAGRPERSAPPQVPPARTSCPPRAARTHGPSGPRVPDPTASARGSDPYGGPYGPSPTGEPYGARANRPGPRPPCYRAAGHGGAVPLRQRQPGHPPAWPPPTSRALPRARPPGPFRRRPDPPGARGTDHPPDAGTSARTPGLPPSGSTPCRRTCGTRTVSPTARRKGTGPRWVRRGRRVRWTVRRGTYGDSPGLSASARRSDGCCPSPRCRRRPPRAQGDRPSRRSR